MTADLHLHTVASDGTQTIPQLAARCAALGLFTIGVTDHDRIDPRLGDRVTMIDGIEVITGIELKADFDGIRGELLGYFVDPGSAALQECIRAMQDARIERMAAMLDACRERVGLDISMAEVRAVAAGSLGRPHLAGLLVAKGAVRTTREAFDKYIGTGGPCYVPLRKWPFRDVVSAIHDAKGVASLAHPCLMRVEDWGAFLERLRVAEVDAVEVFYPYDLAAARARAPAEDLRRLAAERGFLATGGSDDHGPDSVKESLGAIHLPVWHVEALKRACGVT